MKKTSTLMFILMTLSSASLYAQTPSTPPNDLSMGVQFNTLFGSGVSFGMGIGESWRLESDILAGWSKTSAEDPQMDVTNTRATIGLKAHYLVANDANSRYYLGVSTSVSYLRSSTNTTSSLLSLSLGPVFGAEYIVENRIGLGLEAGIQGAQQWSDTALFGDATSVDTVGRLMIRYYF